MADERCLAQDASARPPERAAATASRRRRAGGRSRGGAAGLGIVATALALLLSAGGCTAAPSGPTVVLQPSSGTPFPVHVEVVTTPESREVGLMYRDALGPDAGMLFVFPQREAVSFWMKNTKIPLDILFIADDGTIAKLHARTRPFSEAPLPSGAPVRFVLEVPGGTCAAHGVKEGDRVELGALAGTPAS